MARVAVALRFAGLALVASALLAACGQKRGDNPKMLDVSADAGRMEDEFGSRFGEAFRADPNSDPKNIQDGDVRPVSLITEPVPIN